MPAARLSRRLRGALQREICPEERVEWIARPAPERVEQLQRNLALWLGGTGLAFLASLIGSPLLAGVSMLLGIAVGLLAMNLVNTWRSGSSIAYVVTDQRCFALVAGWRRVHVQDIDEVPEDPRLAPGDLARLREQLAALESRVRTGGRSRSVENARIARDLPTRLRERVRQALTARESLVWVDRPTPRDYFLYAPLDVPTAFAGLLAGMLAIAASGGAFFGLPVALRFAAPAVVLAGFTGLRLWWQIRSTVYAATDRRGLVIAPNGQVRSYSLLEMRRFQRTEHATGRGTLAPAGSLGDGFYGVRDVKIVDDLIKNRSTREHGSEVTPAELPPGRGDEMAPST